MLSLTDGGAVGSGVRRSAVADHFVVAAQPAVVSVAITLSAVSRSVFVKAGGTVLATGTNVTFRAHTDLDMQHNSKLNYDTHSTNVKNYYLQKREQKKVKVAKITILFKNIFENVIHS